MSLITVIAVLDVPTEVAGLSDDDLLDWCTQRLEQRRLKRSDDVAFCSVALGVTPAAVAAGADVGDLEAGASDR